MSYNLWVEVCQSKVIVSDKQALFSYSTDEVAHITAEVATSLLEQLLIS